MNRSATLPQRTKIAQLNERVQDSTTIPYMLNNVNWAPDDTGRSMRAKNSNKFPIRPLPKDPYDTDWEMKKELSNAAGPDGPLISPSRPMPFTDRDMDYMKRKRADEEFAAYESWLSNRFDLNDPAEVQLFKKIAPSYFARREALINEQIDLTSKYAKLKLFGPESEEDLQVEYMVETGRTQLPKGPIWDPWTWMANQAGVSQAELDNDAAGSGRTVFNKLMKYNQATYQAGLFSPLKALSLQSPGPWGLNPYNRQDITGDPVDRAIGPPGAIVPVNTSWVSNYGGARLTGNRQRGGAWNDGYDAADYAYYNNQNPGVYSLGGAAARNYNTNLMRYQVQRGAANGRQVAYPEDFAAFNPAGGAGVFLPPP